MKFVVEPGHAYYHAKVYRQGKEIVGLRSLGKTPTQALYKAVKLSKQLLKAELEVEKITEQT
jgi:hypothetical protein